MESSFPCHLTAARPWQAVLSDHIKTTRLFFVGRRNVIDWLKIVPLTPESVWKSAASEKWFFFNLAWSFGERHKGHRSSLSYYFLVGPFSPLKKGWWFQYTHIFYSLASPPPLWNIHRSPVQMVPSRDSCTLTRGALEKIPIYQMFLYPSPMLTNIYTRHTQRDNSPSH